MINDEELMKQLQKSMRVAKTFNMLLYTTFGGVFLNKGPSRINVDELIVNEDRLKELIDLTFKTVLLTERPNTMPSFGPSETPYFVLNKSGIKIVGIELPDAIEEPQSKYIAYVFGDTEARYYSYEVFSNADDLMLCYKDEYKDHYDSGVVFDKCDNIEEFVENVYKYTLEINNKRLEKAE